MIEDVELQPAGKNKKKTILLIDDNETFVEQIRQYFHEWFQIESVSDGLFGLVETIKLEPDIILLNERVAKIEIAKLCQRIRDITDGLLLVLTDHGMNDEERIACFEAGTDDVLNGNMSLKELILRIQVMIRRGVLMEERQEAEVLLRFGPLRMEKSTYRTYILEEDLILTRKEFSILWTIASKPNQIISRQELLRRVWGYNHMDDDRMIDAHLNRLRKKLQNHSNLIRIKTSWGIGYKLETG